MYCPIKSELFFACFEIYIYIGGIILSVYFCDLLCTSKQAKLKNIFLKLVHVNADRLDHLLTLINSLFLMAT